METFSSIKKRVSLLIRISKSNGFDKYTLMNELQFFKGERMKISKNVKAVLEIVACIMVVIAAAKYANEFEKFVIIMVIGFAVILYDKIWFGLKSVMKWK
jgi:hypothetical protein